MSNTQRGQEAIVAGCGGQDYAKGYFCDADPWLCPACADAWHASPATRCDGCGADITGWGKWHETTGPCCRPDDGRAGRAAD